MKKIFLLGWKDLTLAFRDKAALILMLLAPFALTLGMGLVTGSLSGGGSNTGISAIPIVLVNEDDGAFGKELVQFFKSAEMSDIMLPTEESNLAEAKAQVDEDQIAAVIHIPSGFTASIIPQDSSGKPTPEVKIDLYLNANRPTSSGIVQSIVEQFVYRAQAGSAGVEVMASRLVQSGLLAPQQIAQTAGKLGEMQAEAIHGTPLITLNNVEQGSAPTEFNLLAYMAPGMALMFLMFTVSYGGRSLLVEKTQGTLPRLLVTPIGRGQVLLGKMLGVFFTGLAQMLILILASTLLFQLKWGDPLAVLLLVVAAVIGAVG
ncbi:ABC transporter permease, partial [bacterium]|nr:ABC transporter permease [bacterium]